MADAMGLRKIELEAIEAGLGRLPTSTEVAVFAGMWSEHCSYKSTRHLLGSLPKTGPRILAGPGSHAGTVDVGEGWAVAFKMESHNHPSAVEPYQGAATGVGGILRDIIAQGARPCAVMDALCFGWPDRASTRRLRQGVVAGIAGYGNAFGVPNVGGRIFYDPRYEGNPLVNALAAGLMRVEDGLRTAKARGLGNVLLYVGAATGRDGVLGAAFASEELAEDTVDDRPHVQVGDPFTGKKLMEACMAFSPALGMVAGQDMGAAGITCASIEMAAAGNVGIDVELDAIPLRETQLSPQEIMLSESQERFMFVVTADRAAEAIAHFQSYGVHAVVCGRVVKGDRVRVRYQGEVVVDVPAALVADGAPPSGWPVADALQPLPPYPAFGPVAPDRALLGLLADPCIGDKEPVYGHYDQTVGNRTVRGPDQADAAVIKLPGSRKGFALALASRGDLCDADPYSGTQALLGATCRDLACVGAEMVAITDGLNLASPRDPIENRKLSEVVRGLKEGLEFLEVPVTGGNVSLYNESPKGPIPPTPMVGALGLIEDLDHIPQIGWGPDELVFWLGEPVTTPHTSRFGRWQTHARGGRPAVDLAADRALARLLIAQIRAGVIRSAKDAGAGGLGIALAKLCLRGRLGARVRLPEAGRQDWWLFGESSGCAVVTTAAGSAQALWDAAQTAGVVIRRAGSTGGAHLVVEEHFSLELATLREAFHQSGGQS